MASRASNLAGFVTSISPINNLNVGVVTATSAVIGSGVTINASGISLTGVITATSLVGALTGTATGLSGTPNLNVGVITATSFSGSGVNLTGVGIGSTGNVNTSGIITASSFVGALTGTATGLSGSPNITVGVLTATSLSVPPVALTFSPTDGATGQLTTTNIVITFNQTVTKGTGNITLRNGSAAGSVIETINVTAGTVTISGAAVTIDPVSNLPNLTDVYVVVDAGAITASITGGSNAIINTYNFTTADVALGASYEGGRLICKASPTRWVVATSAAEVSRTWYCRDDANTRAQQVSGCTGWFVPTIGQLQNPGYTCRTYWDSFSATRNWSSTCINAVCACFVIFDSGAAHYTVKSGSYCVRAFRCVTY